MKKTVQKFLALLAIVAIIGGMASCKASDCNCPKFSAKDILK